MANKTFSERLKNVPVTEYIVLIITTALHYSGFVSIKIAGASPLIFIPLCICVCMFCNMAQSLVFCAAAGILADCFAGNTHVFNLAVMLLSGIGLTLTVKYLFNNNFPAALTLTGIISAFYYGAKWFVFYLLPWVDGKMFTLSRIFLPSFIYTVLFIFPIYFITALAKKHITFKHKPPHKQFTP